MGSGIAIIIYGSKHAIYQNRLMSGL